MVKISNCHVQSKLEGGIDKCATVSLFYNCLAISLSTSSSLYPGSGLSCTPHRLGWSRWWLSWPVRESALSKILWSLPLWASLGKGILAEPNIITSVCVCVCVRVCVCVCVRVCVNCFKVKLHNFRSVAYYFVIIDSFILVLTIGLALFPGPFENQAWKRG